MRKSRNSHKIKQSHTLNYKGDYLKKRLDTSQQEYGKDTTEAVISQVEIPLK